LFLSGDITPSLSRRSGIAGDAADLHTPGD
jgi:hypothetical protein